MKHIESTSTGTLAIMLLIVAFLVLAYVLGGLLIDHLKRVRNDNNIFKSVEEARRDFG